MPPKLDEAMSTMDGVDFDLEQPHGYVGVVVQVDPIAGQQQETLQALGEYCRMCSLLFMFHGDDSYQQESGEQVQNVEFERSFGRCSFRISHTRIFATLYPATTISFLQALRT